MKKYILAHPVLFFTTILLGALTQATTSTLAFFSMFVIDAIAYGKMSDLVTAAYLGAAILVVFFAALWGFGRLNTTYIYKVQLKLKSDMFAAILDKNISEFSAENSAKYISVMNNDIKFITDNYIQNILEMTKFIISATLSFVFLTILSPINALIALVLSLAPLVVPLLFGRKLAAVNEEHLAKLSKLNEKVKDFLSGFEVIKTFAIEREVGKIFFKSVNAAELAHLRVGKTTFGLATLTITTLIATQFITYLVAGYLVLTGRITIGAVVAIVGLASELGHPFHLIAGHVAGIVSTKQVRAKLLQLQVAGDMEPKTKSADFTKGIEVRSLRFRYEKKAVASSPKKKKKFKFVVASSREEAETRMKALEEPEVEVLPASTGDILKGISYSFKSGGKYAIVGPSGDGKSTFVKALMGYFDSYEGSIKIGSELREINHQELYEGLAIIHQNVFILDDTLKNNITLFQDYSESEYLQVLERAKLVALANALPNGSETLVGEGGNTLSGGERQRIAIARALIKESKIVIMDEATSNLDNETAYDIEQMLMGTRQTVIFVTHRYSQEVLAQCEGILVLKDGELIESGTFKELYECKGYFYSLFTLSGSTQN